MVDSYVCTLQSVAKGDCWRKAPCCQGTSILFKNQRRTIKGHFDFTQSPPPSAGHKPCWCCPVRRGLRTSSSSMLAAGKVWLSCTNIRLRAEGGYPRSLTLSPNSNSRLLNHRLIPPDSRAKVNIPLLLKAKWLSFINVQNAARRQD